MPFLIHFMAASSSLLAAAIGVYFLCALSLLHFFKLWGKKGAIYLFKS